MPLISIADAVAVAYARIVPKEFRYYQIN